MDSPKVLKAQQLIYLITGYYNNELSAAEMQELNQWIDKSPENKAMFEQVLKADNIDAAVRKMQAYHTREKLEALHTQLPVSKKRQWRILRPYLTAAASLLLVGAVALYLMVNRQKTGVSYIAPQEVLAGTNKATLTLANGKVISLTDAGNGKLAEESGMSIRKTASGEIIYQAGASGSRGKGGQYNTITTPKGGQYQVLLPDGTRIRLNAASTLKYAMSLNERGERRVLLSGGEAYFEVAKDPLHPFIVSSGDQEITVLGTHFNLNCYADEPAMVTTLAEGKVKVSTGSRRSVILAPGQQAANQNDAIQVKAANLSTALAWKDGKLKFQDAGIQEIMRQVARWYNIEIVYEGTVSTDTFTGAIDREANLASVLKMFEASQIHFQVQQSPQGKKLIIKP